MKQSTRQTVNQLELSAGTIQYQDIGAGPGSWIPAWPTRWTSWSTRNAGRPDDAAALDL